MSYEYDPDQYAEDPFANPYGYDDQSMVDFLVANGVGAGLLPTVQPGTGRALTVANRTSALSANRQGLFDTAFQGGFGGADAFAPGAFEPTISTTIRQEPELQQVYSYLRSPTSMEGIITQELMLGGTPATAQRALRQMLTATPEELTEIFTRYDEFFGREPSFNPAEAESFKTNLLLELPPAYDDITKQPMTVEADGTGVNWNFGEDSVFAQAAGISELNAQIPRIGPSAPKWDVDPVTGQPVQVSAGGELQWGTDESGAPVMIEVTETPSQAKAVFDKLGLPDPSQEYVAEDFMTPDQIAMQQAYAQTDDPVAQLKQAWMDPSLAPTNKYTPQRPQGEIPNLTQDQLAVHGPGGTQMANRTDADLLNRYLQGSGVVGSEGGRVVEMPNWEVDPYAPEFGGPPIGSSTGVPPVPSIPPGDIQAPGYDYTDWVPPVDRDGDWAPPTNAVGEVDELGGIYYGNDYGGTGQAGTDNFMARALELFTGMPGPPATAPTTTAPSTGGGIHFQVSGTRGGNVAAPGAQTSAGPVGQFDAGGPVAAAMLQSLLAPQRGPPTTPPGPTQPRPVSASDQLQNQAQAASRAPDWLSHAPGSILTGAGGAQAPNPVTANGQPIADYNAEVAQRQAMMQYTFPEMATGELSARGQQAEAQAEADEQSASILGGSTNRTGKRVRPTRTGEQARQYRAAFDAWDQATDEQQRMKQQAYSFEAGQAAGEAWLRRAQGVKPIDQAMMARRLVMMNAGVPQGI